MAERRSLMAVHAHPDDEVFSTGGILAKYAAEGARVTVVYCTGGEAGEIHHPELDPEEARPRLGDIRREEALAACDILGVTDVYFLGYRDSGMVDTEDNKNPEAFMNAPLDEAVDRLIAIMREARPQVMVTYDVDGGYGHPDHIMANRIATEAFLRTRDEPWGPEKLYYGARSREGMRRQVEVLDRYGLKIPWMNADFNFDEYGLPASEITAQIDVSPYAQLKKQALAVHRTQIPADFFYLSVPDDAAREGMGAEYFMRIQPPASPAEHEDDLFAGTRAQEEAA